MMKPICVKCERFYRPERNGTPFVEMMPRLNGAMPGIQDRNSWQPYKLWQGDLWECKGCGHELIVGVGFQPVAEHYQNDFAKKVTVSGATIVVNDC